MNINKLEAFMDGFGVVDAIAVDDAKGLIRKAYLAGFNASGEGYNAEWPYQDKGKNPEDDPAWVELRESTVEELLE